MRAFFRVEWQIDAYANVYMMLMCVAIGARVQALGRREEEGLH
jgi:hypothetical protein